MKEEQNIPIIIFDDSVKEKITKSLGYHIDKDDDLVDEKSEIITNQDFEPIKYDEFGGVLTGSKVPIKNDEAELVKYFVKKRFK